MAELDLTAIAATSINTPAAGVGAAFLDNQNKTLKTKDDTGFISGQFSNFSVTAQSPAAATRTYITGSSLKIAKNKLQVGSMFRWRMNLTKTGAGTALSTFDVCVGTAATTADTARLSFTKPAGTGVVDEGWIEIVATVRTIGATGVMVGEFTMIHNLAATGHMVIPCACVNAVSAGFDMTVADLFVGVCVTSGALDAITFQMVQADAINV
jgi:hypothetical protein